MAGEKIVKKVFGVQKYMTFPPKPISIDEITHLENGRMIIRCLFDVIGATKDECEAVAEFLNEYYSEYIPYEGPKIEITSTGPVIVTVGGGGGSLPQKTETGENN